MTTMTKPATKRGGPRPNSGRPAIVPGTESIVTTLRLTPLQRDFLLNRLGGGAWVRQQIDKAMLADQEPADSPED